MEEVRELKKIVLEKEKKISLLERRVDELEQYSRMEDVIVSGLNIRHRSYAWAAAGSSCLGGEDDTPGEMYSLEQQVLKFFNSKDIGIDSSTISACHALPRKNSKAKPAIIIRFINWRTKSGLLQEAKKLKGTDECLKMKNADITRQARILRKQKKIQAPWTSNCKVWIKLNGLPEEAKVIMVRELAELDMFK
ncbi:hypothetical protein GJAV_G00072140 [Gymnothorax javanicus]|nr:hypothetical protein GJAV_G00072140 [Gymnothorax javanicus]